MTKPGRDNDHDYNHDNTHASSRLILLAVITGAHGIRGAVKIKPFTETPDKISAYGSLCDEKGKTFDIHIDNQTKDQLICRIKGINDRNAAEAVAKTRLYIDRSQLPDDTEALYQADLIGSEVRDSFNTLIGTVTGFFDFGAGEMIEAELIGGRRVMLPFQSENRIAMDVENQIIQMHIDPIWLESSKNSKPDMSDPDTSSKR